MAETVEFKDADIHKLTAFAKLALQLEIPEGADKDTIAAMIRKAGFTGKSIPVLSAAQPEPTQSSVRGFKKDGDDRTFFRINIPEQDKPGGKEPVPVSVNGSLMLIPRGRDVEVPEEYIEVLKNAVRFKYTPYTGFKDDGSIDLGGLGEPQKVSEFPFSYV